MIYRIEVSTQSGFPDVRGQRILQQITALGIQGAHSVEVADLYFLEGDLSAADVQQLMAALLFDPIVEEARWYALAEMPEQPAAQDTWSVEVTFLPGVTDSVAESLLEGARLIGTRGLKRAATGQRFTLEGRLSADKVCLIARRLLANEVIQTFSIQEPVAVPFVRVTEELEKRLPLCEIIPLAHAGDEELLHISQERRLSLNLAEMQAIQAYFQTQGREPTDVELETLAQTWSEHCVHKTFKALIEYEGPAADGEIGSCTIDGLLKTYIRAATERVNKPWVRSAFVDNAGLVAFDEHFDLAFKVETHNHPSALEPFGGANTGVGGVIRDILGVSARPIANTDVLCFGPETMAMDDLPEGVLHPRRIADGVIAGIEDYGNKMGIPTVNGAILYDAGYTANPLVFCGCLGLLPRGAHPTEPQVGDLIVVIGGHTGRDGVRGATFSSMDLTHETSEIAGTAVQIGHPIHEKQTLEAILQARDERLYNAITDCGAGGLSSAIGEMSAQLGADVHLERVPLKYPGLKPWEIWLSEAQERMVLAVPPAHWPRLQAICQGLDIDATALGHFTGTGQLNIYYGGECVGQLDNDFLHSGLPRPTLRAIWKPYNHPEPALSPAPDLTSALLNVLALPNIRSKEDVVRQYDHEVQSGTVVKPFVGPAGIGPSDAAVLAPLDALRNDTPGPCRGVALAVGINPRYGLIDPYAMAWAVIDEAVRNCVAVGADPDRIALLDNFCWGNPNLPDRLGSLVRCAQGCYDAAIAYAAPFVSGKDSLNNEYMDARGKKQAIPGTLLISALAIVPDVAQTVTSDLKRAGNVLYLVGQTANELGGSSYYQLHGELGARVPQPPAHALALYRVVHQAMRAGLVQSCHDCSEGGLAVAVAEMALAGGRGVEIHLAEVPRAADLQRDDLIAFSESLGRLVIEVQPRDAAAFEQMLAGHPLARIGVVREDARIRFNSIAGHHAIDTDLAAVEQAWRGHFLNLKGETP